jgi:hypothetical protein
MDTQERVNETWRKRSRLGWLPGEKEPDHSTHSPCRECAKRGTCKNICEKLRDCIDKSLGRGYAEKTNREFIVILSEGGQIPNWSSLPDGVDIENHDCQIKFNTDAAELNQTKIFMEYFFNRRPLADIADQFGVTIFTVHSSFRRILDRLDMLLRVIDTRTTAVKEIAEKGNFHRYDDDTKAFLLSHMFGFSTTEISLVLGGPAHKQWERRIKKKRKQIEAQAGI